MADCDKGSIAYDQTIGPDLLIPPASSNPEAHKVFEIGLVLAGAVSAGAYTGGVLDFLFEALDAYEAALKPPEDGHAPCPFSHRVRLKVVSGASAGGMTAAMLATAARRRFLPVRSAVDAAAYGDENPFYRPWVRQIDMRLLLGNRDLLKNAEVRSLLDCTALDEILATSLSFRACPEGEEVAERQWLDQPLRLVFAITNLRGVGYSFGFDGGDGATYAMTRHNDCARFWVNVQATGNRVSGTRPDATPLGFGNDDDSDTWEQLGQVALATAAFPVALRARTVRPNPGIYRAEWFLTHRDAELAPDGDPPTQTRFKSIGHVLHLTEAGSGQADRRYAAADGGVINNEPLELARIELAGILGSNPRDAAKACRAVIMVDPFPDPPTQDTYLDAEKETMLSLAGGVVSAMKNQGRFHPEDVRLALDESVSSRFMISPVGRQRRTGGSAIASGALGGFSGFLEESYRQHDFLLGRANCQKFLKERFCLTLGEPGGQRSWLFEDEPAKIEHHDFTGHDGVVRRPILPLYGTAAEKCPMPEWPADVFHPRDLRGAISRRIQVLGRAFIGKIRFAPLRWFFATVWGASIGGGLLRRQLTTTIVDAVEERLITHELLSGRKGRT